MSDDIYSLAFVCWLSNDAINKYFDVLKGELKDEARLEQEEAQEKDDEEKKQQVSLNS
jgi:hypothetical protein